MSDAKNAAIIAASLAGAYVVYNELNTIGKPGVDGLTPVDRMMGLVRDFAHIPSPTARGPFVQHHPTNLPVITGDQVVPGIQSTRSWQAIQRMAVQLVQDGQGTGAVVAALASVEVQHGDLSVQCDNCNLFSIHAEGNNPYYVRGSAYHQSFLANNDEIEGYRQCMLRFKELMQRPGYQNAIPSMVADDPDSLQAVLGANNWGEAYRSNIPYIRNRLRRLQQLGLITV